MSHADSVLKLRLYLAKGSVEAAEAVAQVHACLQSREGNYSLEVLNANEFRAQALEDGVPFTPLLLRLAPEPVLRIPMPLLDAGELRELLRTSEPVTPVAPVTGDPASQALPHPGAH